MRCVMIVVCATAFSAAACASVPHGAPAAVAEPPTVREPARPCDGPEADAPQCAALREMRGVLSAGTDVAGMLLASWHELCVLGQPSEERSPHAARGIAERCTRMEDVTNAFTSLLTELSAAAERAARVMDARAPQAAREQLWAPTADAFDRFHAFAHLGALETETLAACVRDGASASDARKVDLTLEWLMGNYESAQRAIVRSLRAWKCIAVGCEHDEDVGRSI